MSEKKIATDQKSPNRIFSLDALRGFAILTMVLSGVIPYGVLPAWMYHAQIPPPDHHFNANLPGLTWVDLVFPLFLFALGAAIPMALGRRLQKADSMVKILRTISERTLLLGAFAILHFHFRPHSINPTPDIQAWLIGIAGFILFFGLFARFPNNWDKKLRWSVKGLSWILVLVLLFFIEYADPEKTGFSLSRSNIILIVLTNVYFFGSLIWLFTRTNILARLSILGIYLALRLTHTEPGWVQWLWEFSPIPWIYKMDYLKYLFIVIPGTICGDLMVQWKNKRTMMPTKLDWRTRRLVTIVLIMTAFLIINFVGYQSRLLWQTALLNAVLAGIGFYLMYQPFSAAEKLLKKIYIWGIYWLILGIIFEPFGGGIKKDPSTLSYYFITTALSIFVLIAFAIIIDILKKQHWVQLLIDNGQNPMIAYVGFGMFIWPLLALSGLESIIINLTPTPWLGFLRGLFYTFILALMVRWFTRHKIFWRT